MSKKNRNFRKKKSNLGIKVGDWFEIPQIYTESNGKEKRYLRVENVTNKVIGFKEVSLQPTNPNPYHTLEVDERSWFIKYFHKNVDGTFFWKTERDGRLDFERRDIGVVRNDVTFCLKLINDELRGLGLLETSSSEQKNKPETTIDYLKKVGLYNSKGNIAFERLKGKYLKFVENNGTLVEYIHVLDIKESGWNLYDIANDLWFDNRRTIEKTTNIKECKRQKLINAIVISKEEFEKAEEMLRKKSSKSENNPVSAINCPKKQESQTTQEKTDQLENNIPKVGDYYKNSLSFADGDREEEYFKITEVTNLYGSFHLVGKGFRIGLGERNNIIYWVNNYTTRPIIVPNQENTLEKITKKDYLKKLEEAKKIPTQTELKKENNRSKNCVPLWKRFKDLEGKYIKLFYSGGHGIQYLKVSKMDYDSEDNEFRISGFGPYLRRGIIHNGWDWTNYVCEKERVLPEDLLQAEEISEEEFKKAEEMLREKLSHEKTVRNFLEKDKKPLTDLVGKYLKFTQDWTTHGTMYFHLKDIQIETYGDYQCCVVQYENDRFSVNKKGGIIYLTGKDIEDSISFESFKDAVIITEEEFNKARSREGFKKQEKPIKIYTEEKLKSSILKYTSPDGSIYYLEHPEIQKVGIENRPGKFKDCVVSYGIMISNSGQVHFYTPKTNPFNPIVLLIDSESDEGFFSRVEEVSDYEWGSLNQLHRDKIVKI